MSPIQTDRPRDTLAKLRIERTAETPQRTQGGFWKWALGLALVILAIAAAWGAVRAGWISNTAGWLAVPEAIKPRIEVRVASVTVESGRSADAVVVATGYLESRRQAMIGARAPGRIEVVNVEEGTRVTRNEVLAVLEHADLDAALAAAQATLARAKAELEEQRVEIDRAEREHARAEKLFNQKIMPDSEYDEAKFKYEGALARRGSLEAAVALAEARVKEAEQLKENMFIRAPFDGTVISKDAEVGESILPGGMGEASGRGSVVTIADLDHLEVDCDVKEGYIARVAIGQTAEVAVDAVPGHRYQGRVRKIIPMGDRARATIKVKVEILDADQRLFPEMSSTAYFLPDDSVAVSQEPRVFCRTEAVQGDESRKYVWVVDDKSYLRRANIEVGAQRDGRSEVLSGLSGGEWVVVGPPPGLREGQLVKATR